MSDLWWIMCRRIFPFLYSYRGTKERKSITRSGFFCFSGAALHFLYGWLGGAGFKWHLNDIKQVPAWRINRESWTDSGTFGKADVGIRFRRKKRKTMLLQTALGSRVGMVFWRKKRKTMLLQAAQGSRVRIRFRRKKRKTMLLQAARGSRVGIVFWRNGRSLHYYQGLWKSCPNQIRT